MNYTKQQYNFIRSTADDYDLPYETVARIYDAYYNPEHPALFYEQLEYLIDIQEENF